MPATLELTKETNDLNYTEIDTTDLLPLGDGILCQWQFAQEGIKVGDKVLIRPDKYRRQHYTATVIEVGDDVDPKIKTGDRIVFDQFSDLKKYWHPKYGRLAIIHESKQGYLFMVIPERIEIGDGENDYDYSR